MRLYEGNRKKREQAQLFIIFTTKPRPNHKALIICYVVVVYIILKSFCETLFKKLFTSDKNFFLKVGLAFTFDTMQCV